MGSLEIFVGVITSAKKWTSFVSFIGTWQQYTKSKMYSILSVAFLRLGKRYNIQL